MNPPPPSRNATVGATALVVSALATLVMTVLPMPLTPLRVLTLALATFAVWAFSDEMGLRKPLNRAAFVCFAAAAFARIQIALGGPTLSAGRYWLFYAAFLLLATLLWSVALLHRQPQLKVVGAAGLAVTALPIALIVFGHLVVGVGAVAGVRTLLEAAQGDPMTDTTFISLVERIFGVWALAAAWLLGRGRIHDVVPAGKPLNARLVDDQ